ncbi:MAG: glycosyltransferase [Syntrophobacteraceae bacterium]
MRVTCFTDLRFTAGAQPTGVPKHLVRMIFGLADRPDVKLTMIATGDQLDGNKIPRENRLHGLPVNRLPGTNNTLEALWQLLHYPQVDRWIGEADWVYCPKNDLVPVKNARWAVTIHSTYECCPTLNQTGGKRIASRVTKARCESAYRYMASRADLILTVSVFEKERIVSQFGASPDRVVVVGNGVEEVYYQVADTAKGISRRGGEQPYILSVGGLNYLDGGDYLLNVARVLAPALPEIRILVAGAQHERPYLAQAADIGNIELLGYVPAARLAGLMRDAELFLFLTRYESFGIAVAEAMAAGAPVIASDKTAVPEVVGDGGIIVDPEKTHLIADMIKQLYLSPARREELRLRGIERAARYTWKACADRLFKALTQ